jgi:competence protein ComEC
MVDPAILFGLALLVGQRAASAPLAAAVVAAGAALALWRRVGPLWLAAALAVAAGSSWRARRAVEAAEAERAQIRDWIGPPSRCEARALVLSSPVRRGDSLRWLARLDDLDCEGRRLDRPVVARLYGGPADLARGAVLPVTATLAPAQLFFDPDLPDPAIPAARAGTPLSGAVVAHDPPEDHPGIGALIDRARARVRGRIEASYHEAAAPLGRALVLGEDDLDPEEGEAFRQSGLSHLLAVSGSHLALAVMGLVRAIEALLVRTRWLSARLDVARVAAAIGVVVAFGYADFAGSSGSAVRAAVMLAALLGAQALGRRGSGPRALGLSVCALCLADPLAAFDLSFTLSAAATAGLLCLARPAEALLARWLPGLLAAPLATTLAATVACAPLLTALSPTLPLAGVLANLVAVPLGELAALPACLAHAVAWPFPPLERGLALLGSGALLAVRAVALASASQTWARVPLPPLTSPEAALLALGSLALWRLPGRRGLVLLVSAAALLLAEGLAIRDGMPRDTLRVTSLDVGQGDSTLIDLPDGSLFLVDGGGFVGSPVDPGRSVLLPSLRARRRGRVDVAVLSHPHPDHFLGLASALPALEVGALWDTGQGEDEGAGPVYRGMIDGLRKRGVPVLRPRDLCGRVWHHGAARVEALAPCPGYAPFGNANDNSLVLRLSLGRRSVLLMGDAEAHEEASLLARAGSLRADLLKAGHHGSRTSSTRPFLEAVRPGLTVLSCGVRNRFGHPHPTTLASLAALGLPFARTDRGGAVIWQTDGERVQVTRAAPVR